MDYYVYIIKCKDDSFYTGITQNLNKRIKEHNLRIKSPLQKSKIPVRLVYWERLDSKMSAQ